MKYTTHSFNALLTIFLSINLSYLSANNLISLRNLNEKINNLIINIHNVEQKWKDHYSQTNTIMDQNNQIYQNMTSELLPQLWLNSMILKENNELNKKTINLFTLNQKLWEASEAFLKKPLYRSIKNKLWQSLHEYKHYLKEIDNEHHFIKTNQQQLLDNFKEKISNKKEELIKIKSKKEIELKNFLNHIDDLKKYNLEIESNKLSENDITNLMDKIDDLRQKTINVEILEKDSSFWTSMYNQKKEAYDHLSLSLNEINNNIDLTKKKTKEINQKIEFMNNEITKITASYQLDESIKKIDSDVVNHQNQYEHILNDLNNFYNEMNKLIKNKTFF